MRFNRTEMELSGTDKKSIFLKKPKLMYIGVYRHSHGGWMNKLHCHDFCEIMLVKSGSGKFRVNDETYPFQKGDMIGVQSARHAQRVL